MKTSKLLENTVNRYSFLDDYYVEDCDGLTQHWVHAKYGYVFPETECGTCCGFNVREINKVIKTAITEAEFIALLDSRNN